MSDPATKHLLAIGAFIRKGLQVCVPQYSAAYTGQSHGMAFPRESTIHQTGQYALIDDGLPQVRMASSAAPSGGVTSYIRL
jgi:hypothetical protein